MSNFVPGRRIVYLAGGDLATPGTLVSRNKGGLWKIRWDDGLTADTHCFEEERLVMLVCEKGS